jgi:hypothetical protein
MGPGDGDDALRCRLTVGPGAKGRGWASGRVPPCTPETPLFSAAGITGSRADRAADGARRPRAPVLAIGDGALGFWAALREVFPRLGRVRCWFHARAPAPDPGYYAAVKDRQRRPPGPRRSARRSPAWPAPTPPWAGTCPRRSGGGLVLLCIRIRVPRPGPGARTHGPSAPGLNDGASRLNATLACQGPSRSRLTGPRNRRWARRTCRPAIAPERQEERCPNPAPPTARRTGLVAPGAFAQNLAGDR